jgi:hypothetical protein
LEVVVSIHPLSLTGRFAIRELGSDGIPFYVSGELHVDETLHEYPASLTVFGYRSDHIAMLKHAGRLVHADFVAEREDRVSRSYIVRVHDAGWSLDADSKQLAKIATLSIEKAIEEFASSPSRGLGFCSYSYTSDVSDWPTAGGFGISYEGTIELRKFRNGPNIITRGKLFEVQASPHYYFVREGRKLTRQQVASISVTWFSPVVDWKRLIECARIVLSFTHVVKLRPLSKTQVCNGSYRKVSWNTPDISYRDSDRLLSPVEFFLQKKFHGRAVRKLYQSSHPIEALDDIVDRYVECRVDTTLERSFTHGCEAIEGLYALLNMPTHGGGAPNYAPLKRRIKRLLNENVRDPLDKSLATSRTDQLFSRPTWRRISDTILKIARSEDALIRQALSRANFFRYRNLTAHGRVVRLENEVVFQAALMRFVLEWMFLRVCGGSGNPSSAREIEGHVDQPRCPDVGLIKLWE